MRRDVGVVLTDPHCVAETGVLPPDATGDDGARLHQNKAQQFVWRAWTQAQVCAKTDLTPTDDGKRWLFVLGDLMENRHHDTTQLATLNQAAMRRITAQALKPWVDWSDYTFLARGTPAHAGPAAADEETIGELLAAQCPGKIQRDRRTGMATAFSHRVRIQQTTHDLAHHPLAGTGREYLAHSPAGTTAIGVLLDYLLTHDDPPTIAWRGHTHPRRRPQDSGLTYATRCVVVNAWKLVDEFQSRRTPGAVNTIGCVFFTVTGSQVNLWPVLYTPRRPAAWTEPTAPTSTPS